MSWSFPGFGRPPFVASNLARWSSRFTVPHGFGSSINPTMALMYPADNPGGNDKPGAGNKKGDHDGDSESPTPAPNSQDPIRSNRRDIDTPKPLQADDISRMNRATGVLAELSQNDRTCPADGSTALGPNDERTRQIAALLRAIENRTQDEKTSLSEKPATGATPGERCNYQWLRDSSSALHDWLAQRTGDWAATDAAGAVNDFARHNCEGKAAVANGAKGVDKYHHCMANCEATDRGLAGAFVAFNMSTMNEVKDILYANPVMQGKSLEASLVDSRKDMAANLLGIFEGARAGTRCEATCSVLDPRSRQFR